MKEAIVHPGPQVEIIDSPIPHPGADQLVIKVVVSSSNPKDWKVAEWWKTSANSGDDIAGIVHSVGENVFEFKPGDRVAAFHEMRTPGGSYAEYALAWQHTTFHIPKKTTFEGRNISCNRLTIKPKANPESRHRSSYSSSSGNDCCNWPLCPPSSPEPWLPAASPIPLVVYGGSSAVGAFVLKFAARANIHPLIVVAGNGASYVETLIDRSKGDTIVDYRKGNDAVVSGIKDALKGAKLSYAFDAVSEKGSYQNIVQVLDPHGNITLVLPGKEYKEIPKTVAQSLTNVGSAHGNNKDLAYIYFRYMARGLHEGWFKGHPPEVVPGGLGGIQQALKNLKDGKASAVKYVFRIADTEGVKSASL